jgi:hypothetical protein
MDQKSTFYPTPERYTLADAYRPVIYKTYKVTEDRYEIEASCNTGLEKVVNTSFMKRKVDYI